jgi:hypothetical protein
MSQKQRRITEIMETDRSRNQDILDAIHDNHKKLEEKIVASQMALEEKMATRFDEVLSTVLGSLNKQEERITSLEQRMLSLEKTPHGLQEGQGVQLQDIEEVKETVTKTFQQIQERMKRESQIRITGLEEEPNESLRDKVQSVFQQKMGVAGVDSMILDVFRIGRTESGSKGRPRVVIVRTGSQMQRNYILRGKKNLAGHKGLGVDVDRTKEEVEQLKKELQKKKEIESKGGRARWLKGKVVEIGVETTREVTSQSVTADGTTAHENTRQAFQEDLHPTPTESTEPLARNRPRINRRQELAAEDEGTGDSEDLQPTPAEYTQPLVRNRPRNNRRQEPAAEEEGTGDSGVGEWIQVLKGRNKGKMGDMSLQERIKLQPRATRASKDKQVTQGHNATSDKGEQEVSMELEASNGKDEGGKGSTSQKP